MVVVSAGEYMMGSGRGEGPDDERPRHWVRIPGAIAVGKYEVTFGEWDACVAGGGCGGYRPGDLGWGTREAAGGEGELGGCEGSTSGG